MGRGGPHDSDLDVVPAERMKAKVGAQGAAVSERASESCSGLRRALGKHPELSIFLLRVAVTLTDMALTKFLRTHKAASDVPERAATAHGFRSSRSEIGPVRLACPAIWQSVRSRTTMCVTQLKRPTTGPTSSSNGGSVMEAWANHVAAA